MIYLKLFISFFKIGIFSFGGAYAAIPIIKDEVIAQGWMTEEMFANMIGISESTPGPIMVNAATYVGSKMAGIFGAILATLGVILPAFFIILFIVWFFRPILKKQKVKASLEGVKQCVSGIILSTGVYMGYVEIFLKKNGKIYCDHISVFVIFLLLTANYLLKKLYKKEGSPIMLIIFSGILGAILY